jgi:hypothetical protein
MIARFSGVDFDIVQYRLRAEMAAAFDLFRAGDFLESRTPDSPVVLNATDAVETFCWARSIGSVAACHERVFPGKVFRLSERGNAVRAVATTKGFFE